MTKRLGEKVLGWFIVDESEGSEPAPVNEPVPAPAPARAPEEAAANAPIRTRIPAAGLSPTPAPLVAPGHPHDARAFAAVYRNAGVSDDERDRLTKVVSLVEGLPSEATTEVKRAIVAASLEAFGVSIDRILVTGEGAVAALDGYVVAGQNRTKDVLAQAESRIEKLTSEIEEVRRLMDIQVAAQQELARATMLEKARVRVVLDFFDDGISARAASRPGDGHSARRLVRLK